MNAIELNLNECYKESYLKIKIDNLKKVNNERIKDIFDEKKL